MSNELSGKAFLVVSIVLLAIVVALPLAAIWSFNTLFQLNINYGFWELLAAVVLIQMFGGARQVAKTVDNGFNQDQKIGVKGFNK